ncbi:zf-HC2 domain-containing protein [Anaeromyxobacter terrae]|uniref:zf-HC2 domain-containing protein n=1 Tax=Anaeromyxobacter terrae TaxID=2925406 RepID=UPI001F56AA6C|nr:zf-HC2 domain-containing protein [Anaeromyxobacter sp. SG22]
MSSAPPCSEYDLLLSLHAANALRGEERARLEAHLASCPACRDDVEASAEVLRLARLPAPTPAERRVLADLPERAVEAVRQGERRRGVVRRIALAMSAVAALSLVPLLPFVTGTRRPQLGDLPRVSDVSGSHLGTAVELRGPALALDRSTGGEHPQLASATGSGAVAVQAASWQEPDPDDLWEDSTVLQSLGDLEETTFAAEAAMQ